LHTAEAATWPKPVEHRLRYAAKPSVMPGGKLNTGRQEG